MARFNMSSVGVLLAALVAGASAGHLTVNVGKGGQLKFDPETLTAQPGDTITYKFFSKNHTVTQSSFSDPCHTLSPGFFSGFTPTASDSDPSRTDFTIHVNDTKPIWVYCSQGNHCASGMVHSVNAPTSGNTFDAFKNLATAVKTPSTFPPDGLPVGGTRTLHVDVAPSGTLTFSPNNITELPRTVVEFSFNPANHSVVQSNFADPCHPLQSGGFSSGFIPTTVSPSGALFSIVIPDTKPIWFYCAQPGGGGHCQKGMVGSINAATSGPNTLEAFIGLAAKASVSTIPPQAPLVGVLRVNGTEINSLHGAVLTPGSLDPDNISKIPPPGTEADPYLWGMAGGGTPSSYNWAGSMTDNTTDSLQLLGYLDNLLVWALYDGYNRLKHGGAWAGQYPDTIVDTIGSMAAQALVHRSTATDSLQHFQKPFHQMCTYTLPDGDVDSWLHATLTLVLINIGFLMDLTTQASASDPWLVPCLVTALGAKSRMTAVINLMQDHIAAAAPREVVLPKELVYSYAATNYVSSCPDDASKAWGPKYPALRFASTAKLPGSDRVASVTVDAASLAGKGSLQLAWIGPWGQLEFVPVAADGSAPVPSDLYGHVWAVLVSQADVKLRDIPSVTVAGPEILWISQP